MPAPLVDPAHSLGPPLTDLVSEIYPEAIDPKTDAFVAIINAPFVKQIFDVAKRQGKSDMHQYAKREDLGRSLEVPERVPAHLSGLTALTGRLKTRFL